MKKILNQECSQYELSQNEVMDIQTKLENLVKRDIKNEYIFISTPTELIVLDRDSAIITISAKSYTAKELLVVIEKAAKYDGLSK